VTGASCRPHASHDRQTIGGAGSKAPPHAQDPPSSQAGEQAARVTGDRVDAPAVHPKVGARELEHAGNAEPAGERCSDDPVLGEVHGERRVAGRIGEVDVVALAALDRHRDRQSPGKRRTPCARREHDLAGRDVPRRRPQSDRPSSAPADREHLDSCAELNAELPGGVRERTDEPLGVAVCLVRGEDRSGRLCDELGTRCMGGSAIQDLVRRSQEGARRGQGRWLLIDAQESAVDEACVQPPAERPVKLGALACEPAQHPDPELIPALR
jgi:hypothetical protein